MKRYEIIRTDPNNGYVTRLSNHLQRIKVSDVMPYRECMEFVMHNQEEGTIFKIAKLANRRNARRTLYDKILVADKNEAIRVFDHDYCNEYADYTLQLCTGDWQIIAQCVSGGPVVII